MSSLPGGYTLQVTKNERKTSTETDQLCGGVTGATREVEPQQAVTVPLSERGGRGQISVALCSRAGEGSGP